MEFDRSDTPVDSSFDSSFIGLLEPVVLDNLYEHIFDLFVSHRPELNQNLGFISRAGSIEIPIEDNNPLAGSFEISQSISTLHSTSESSTTGALVWQVSVHLARWISAALSTRNPLWISQLVTMNTSVIELGCGASGILPLFLEDKVSKYIATDQAHILKLTAKNIEHNESFRATVSSSGHERPPKTPRRSKHGHKNSQLHAKETSENFTKISLVEYDWEYAEQNVQDVEKLVDQDSPILIIACDTIYNDYLIPHFVHALDLLMNLSTKRVDVIIAQQLRSEEVLEAFLTELLLNDFKLWKIPASMLSLELDKGFVVHYVQKKTNHKS